MATYAICVVSIVMAWNWMVAVTVRRLFTDMSRPPRVSTQRLPALVVSSNGPVKPAAMATVPLAADTHVIVLVVLVTANAHVLPALLL